MGTTTTQITWEEFLQLPEEPGKQELLDGEVIHMPPARYQPHMRISTDVFLIFLAAVTKARARHEVGYQLRRGGWLVPDVAVDWPEQEFVDGFPQGAPMIAVEVVSPSNLIEHLEKKIATYFEEGAAEVWAIYPSNRCMIVYRKGTWERVTESYRCELLNLTIDVAALFA